MLIWGIVTALLLGVAVTITFYLTKRRYSSLKLTEVNDLLSQILEINFKNNSLSNAAQSILAVLQHYYKMDYITILIYNEKSNKLSIIASNVSNEYLEDVEAFCNKSLRELKSYSARLITNDEGYLSYNSAEDREVSLSSFTPLDYKRKLIGGILLESKDSRIFDNTDSRQSFYSKIFKSTALVLQNVLYTENLIAMTSTDQLTGVYNRRFIDMTLGEQLTIHRSLGLSLSVVLFDIDHFKKFNDTYGHPFGDLVLQEVAKFMKDRLPDDAWIARYGGEEFVLFFGRSNPQDVYERVDTLREGLSKYEFSDGKTTASVTASFGIASFPHISGSHTFLIEQADQALYASKKAGRNRVTLA